MKKLKKFDNSLLGICDVDFDKIFTIESLNNHKIFLKKERLFLKKFEQKKNNNLEKIENLNKKLRLSNFLFEKKEAKAKDVNITELSDFFKKNLIVEKSELKLYYYIFLKRFFSIINLIVFLNSGINLLNNYLFFFNLSILKKYFKILKKRLNLGFNIWIKIKKKIIKIFKNFYILINQNKSFDINLKFDLKKKKDVYNIIEFDMNSFWKSIEKKNNDLNLLYKNLFFEHEIFNVNKIKKSFVFDEININNEKVTSNKNLLKSWSLIQTDYVNIFEKIENIEIEGLSSFEWRNKLWNESFDFEIKLDEDLKKTEWFLSLNKDEYEFYYNIDNYNKMNKDDIHFIILNYFWNNDSNYMLEQWVRFRLEHLFINVEVFLYSKYKLICDYYFNFNLYDVFVIEFFKNYKNELILKQNKEINDNYFYNKNNLTLCLNLKIVDLFFVFDIILNFIENGDLSEELQVRSCLYEIFNNNYKGYIYNYMTLFNFGQIINEDFDKKILFNKFFTFILNKVFLSKIINLLNFFDIYFYFFNDDFDNLFEDFFFFLYFINMQKSIEDFSFFNILKKNLILKIDILLKKKFLFEFLINIDLNILIENLNLYVQKRNVVIEIKKKVEYWLVVYNNFLIQSLT